VVLLERETPLRGIYEIGAGQTVDEGEAEMVMGLREVRKKGGL